MSRIRRSVLRSTFLHLPGVGPVTEAAWRSRGLEDWSDLATSGLLDALPEAFRRKILDETVAGEAALQAGDAGWFARRLPEIEMWRLHPEFGRTTAFLDIETTSLSPFEGIVTVVSVHGPNETRTFVADSDLEELPAYLRRFGVLVTFNGKLFDVPFLSVRFPEAVWPEAHIDLRFVLRRLGLTGGLKMIEQRLGLGDRSGVEGISGIDAVRLWMDYRRGNGASLERLIRYNRADTINLRPLLDFATRELSRRVLMLDSVLEPNAGGVAQHAR